MGGRTSPVRELGLPLRMAGRRIGTRVAVSMKHPAVLVVGDDDVEKAGELGRERG